jgi:hypothetical protein
MPSFGAASPLPDRGTIRAATGRNPFRFFCRGAGPFVGDGNARFSDYAEHVLSRGVGHHILPGPPSRSRNQNVGGETTWIELLWCSSRGSGGLMAKARTHIAAGACGMDEDSLDALLRLPLTHLIHFRSMWFRLEGDAVKPGIAHQYVASITYETDPPRCAANSVCCGGSAGAN